MLIATIAVALLLLVVIHYLAKRVTNRVNADPPGPGSYPLIGSLFHLREPWFHFLYEKFAVGGGGSGIQLMYFGTQRVYVLSRWAEFKAAMVDNADALAGRPTQNMTRVMFGDIGGVVASDGLVWREYRRFTLQTLRDLGLGRRGVEEAVQEEAHQLVSALSSGQPVDTALVLSTASANVICQLVFGSRVASEEQDFTKLLEAFGNVMHNKSYNLHSYIFLALDPIIGRYAPLARLMSSSPASRHVMGSFRDLIDFCHRQRATHAAELAEAGGGPSEPRDYIDAHLMRTATNDTGGSADRDNEDAATGGDASIFNDNRLALAVVDLFIAGTDTTSNTLRWALLYMLRHTDAARRVREEIRREIGDHRPPGLQDRKALHFTQATLEEVHRCASLVALGMPHRLEQDITIGGYQLPRDSLVMFNTYAIHRDPQLFPEPEAFRPDRHLTPAGQFTPCQNLTTFGLGRRTCLGEGLARTELFVFFVTIMQRFDFRLEPTGSSGGEQLLADLMDRQENFKGTMFRSLPPHRLLFEPLTAAV